MAQLATRLHNEGHEVLWLDPLAEKIEWWRKIRNFKPNSIILEAKTPTINRTEEIVRILCRSALYDAGIESKAFSFENIKIVGDHTRNPIYPYNDFPLINRQLTRWKLYSKHNGNYLRTPGAYTQFARDCWHGKCTFCSWPHNLYPNYKVSPISNALAEVENLISLDVRFIFDDSGSFPNGDWLFNFCKEMRKHRYQNKVNFGANLRFSGYDSESIRELAETNFKFALFGLESAHDSCLDKLGKGYRREDVERGLADCKRYKIKAHVTVMFGYPWETEAEAQQTVEYCRSLFKRGLIQSLQATVIIPYPGTPLFQEAKEKGWLLTEDWDKYDMSQPVLKCSYDPFKYVKACYWTALASKNLVRLAAKPEFVLRAVKRFFAHV